MPDIKFVIAAIRQRLGLDFVSKMAGRPVVPFYTGTPYPGETQADVEKLGLARDLSPGGANQPPVGRSPVQLHQELGRSRYSEVVDSPRNEEAEYLAGKLFDQKEELNRPYEMGIEAKKQLEERTRELNAIRAAATQVKKAPNAKKLAYSLYRLLAMLKVDVSTMRVDIYASEAEGVVVGYEPEGQKKGTPHKEAVFALQPEGTCQLNPYSRTRDPSGGVDRGKTINNRRELWETVMGQSAPEWVEK